MASRRGQQTEVNRNDCVEEDAEMAPEISHIRRDDNVQRDASNPANHPSELSSVLQEDRGVGAYGGNRPYQVVGFGASSQICPSSSTQKGLVYDGHAQNAWTHQHNLITEDDIPASLKEGQFDILLLYSDQDKANALKFKGIVERFVQVDGKKLRICVLDEDLVWIESKFAHMEEAIARSTYMFLYVTEAFCNDAWASMQKDEVLMASITNPDKRWCVVPLFVDGRNNQRYTLPFGIRGLKGIDVSLMLTKCSIKDVNIGKLTSDDLDTFIIGNIQKMVKSRVDLRRKRERDAESKLREWKEKEYIQRLDEMVRKQGEVKRLREKEALLRRPTVEPLVQAETMTQTSEEATQVRSTEESRQTNIVVTINTVQNLQIGSNNQIHIVPDNESETSGDEELHNTVVPPVSHSPISQLPLVVDITPNSSSNPSSTQTGQVMVKTQVSADCGSGDTVSSVDDTSLKQHCVRSSQDPAESVDTNLKQHLVGSTQDRIGSLQDEETLRPARDDGIGMTAKRFGIDVRSNNNDADNDVNLKQFQTSCRMGDSTVDEDTDLLKPRFFTGPAGDQSVRNYPDGTRCGEIETDGPDSNDMDVSSGTSPTGDATDTSHVPAMQSSTTCPAELCKKTNCDTPDEVQTSRMPILSKIKSMFNFT